jgi:hypothetical protein
MLTTIVATFTAANVFVPVISHDARPTPTASPTLQLGVLSEPLTGELSTAAKTWALTNRAGLGLHPASTLTFEVGFATRFGASLHYLQRINDIDIYQAKLVLTIDDKSRIVQVSSSLVDNRQVRSQFEMSEAAALHFAGKQVSFPALRHDDPTRPYGAAKKVLFAVSDELHAGWLVHVASYDPSKNFYVGLDAVTGETLFVQNRVHHQSEFELNAYPISPGDLDGGVGRTPTEVRTMLRAGGSSFIGDSCETFLSDGGFLTTSNDAGVLCGETLTSYNCCARENCDLDAGSRRVSGPTTFMGFTLNVDLPICDRVNQATNQRIEANYRYEPFDPPLDRMTVDIADPANSDTFAQVHAFYHVSRLSDWVRGLSTRGATLFPANQPAIGPFRMRDERRVPARKPAILTNVMVPNFQAIQGIPQCLPPPIGQGMGTCLIRGFSRVDNAAFLPVEGFAQFPIPGLSTGVDTLMMFQGNAADAAYDATVLWHEFGHGVVYATAALTFNDVAIDNRSANNEGGALHEGFGDYIAAAFGNTPEVGPYFGPRAFGGAPVMGVRQDNYLRSLSNTLACPDVLWGEVHQDAKHVGAALWSGRLANLGTDNGATYDAAFYAMLVSLAPNADFAAMAQTMAARVTGAFNASAGAAMTATFQAKGVIGCSKVLDVTNATAGRPFFGIAAAPMLPQATIPGPFQFKLRVPTGAQGIRIRGAQGGGGGGFGGGMAPALTILTKTGSPISFTRNGAQLTNDAETTATVQASGGMIDRVVPVQVSCGATEEVYVAIAARGSTTIQNLQVTAVPLVNCTLDAGVEPDAGTEPDAGLEPDAGPVGTETKMLPRAGIIAQPTAQAGCGCSTFEGSAVLAALAILGRRRRR